MFSRAGAAVSRAAAPVAGHPRRPLDNRCERSRSKVVRALARPGIARSPFIHAVPSTPPGTWRRGPYGVAVTVSTARLIVPDWRTVGSPT